MARRRSQTGWVCSDHTSRGANLMGAPAMVVGGLALRELRSTTVMSQDIGITSNPKLGPGCGLVVLAVGRWAEMTSRCRGCGRRGPLPWLRGAVVEPAEDLHVGAGAPVGLVRRKWVKSACQHSVGRPAWRRMWEERVAWRGLGRLESYDYPRRAVQLAARRASRRSAVQGPNSGHAARLPSVP